MTPNIVEQLDRRRPRSGWTFAALVLTPVIALIAYLWRRLRWLPMEEQEVEIDPMVPQAPLHAISGGDRPDGAERNRQLSGKGSGPVFHRRYRVDISEKPKVQRMSEDP